MKQITLLLAFIAFSFLAKAQYIPEAGDFVKPKSWSSYPFTYPVWTDPTGSPSPYARYLDWVNKRCLVSSVWQQGGQWYVELNILGTSNYAVWPVNYVTTLPATTTDLLVHVL